MLQLFKFLPLVLSHLSLHFFQLSLLLSLQPFNFTYIRRTLFDQFLIPSFDLFGLLLFVLNVLVNKGSFLCFVTFIVPNWFRELCLEVIFFGLSACASEARKRYSVDLKVLGLEFIEHVKNLVELLFLLALLPCSNSFLNGLGLSFDIILNELLCLFIISIVVFILHLIDHVKLAGDLRNYLLCQFLARLVSTLILL